MRKNPNDAVDMITLYMTYVRFKKKIKQIEVRPLIKKRK